MVYFKYKYKNDYLINNKEETGYTELLLALLNSCVSAYPENPFMGC